MGQEGGIEGLAQKIWAWIYVTVANRVAENLGYTCKSMVNGVDLRKAICIPASDVPLDPKPFFWGISGFRLHNECG